MRAGIALGSNLGDRLGNLSMARRQISALPQVQPPVLASAAYETEPVACEPGAPKFLNAVMEIEYAGEPEELLRELRGIESALGRTAAAARNVSRTADLDLLYFGDVQVSGAELELPHPRMHGRRFVLEPLAEIRPELILPAQSVTVAELLHQIPDTEPLVRFASEW
jgi:2-amino-4-hydroxy-6-hydroxymethyldihydropteridine diphosphokinase